MKQIKTFLLIAVLALISCGGGDDVDPFIPEPVPEEQETPTTTEQTVVFKASTQLQQTVALIGLKAAVANIRNDSEWVTNITTLGYGGTGAPNVSITVSENTSKVSRSYVVTFTDTKQNTVNLTVTQEAPDTPPPGIDDPHNTQSDQPAYCRQQ